MFLQQLASIGAFDVEHTIVLSPGHDLEDFYASMVEESDQILKECAAVESADPVDLHVLVALTPTRKPEKSSLVSGLISFVSQVPTNSQLANSGICFTQGLCTEI